MTPRRTLLTDKENEAAAEFVWRHYEDGSHGPHAEAQLTASATGIAFAIKIKCPWCKKSEDITDYDSW